MIVVFHDRAKVTKILDIESNQDHVLHDKTIQGTLFHLASIHMNDFICWCHHKLEKNIDRDNLEVIFHQPLVMASFSTSKDYAVPSDIGYTEDSTPFLNVKHDVVYPTWLMSSDIGGIHPQVLVQFKKLAGHNISFDSFLNHLSKQAMTKGLFCYSDPRLLMGSTIINETTHRQINLFSFVKNHYRFRWVFILFLDYAFYEKRFKFWQIIKALCTPEIAKDKIDFSHIKVNSSSGAKDQDRSYDVLIPTLGRSKELKDVLIDLSQQTYLPKKVIIVEQNDLPDSRTELDYIHDQKWPFLIDHIFIHQLGACNARNIALTKITSPWVFFADDDIRFDKDLIENAYKFIKQYGASVVNLAILRKDENLTQTVPLQWHTFGSGCSFLKSSVIKDIKFGLEHEFGFGEDSDFGMQLRNRGTDILYCPHDHILHLKSPIGGFRTKTSLPWDIEDIPPKPSPMVMAHRLKHTTKHQLLGYKTTLFIKFYRSQKNLNPFSYFRNMSKSWNKSIYWAKKLIDKYNPNGI